MSTLVEIGNHALDLVGQGVTINAVDDVNDPNARAVNKHIYASIREVLRAGKWKPARKRETLAALAQAPDFEWTYQYQLPNDYLRMVFFNGLDPYDERRPMYTIEGRLLLTDESTVSITYVADLTYAGNDVNVTDPLLNELFVLKLASKLAWPFQQTRTLKESLLNEYAAKLKLALAADSREERAPLINRMSESEWIQRRMFSTNA